MKLENRRMRGDALPMQRARVLRRELSLPEVLLWQRLRGRRLQGLHFRRQHPMLGYILDFYCADRRLAVEVDGKGHGADEQIEHDKRRDARLVEVGVLTLRFGAASVLHDEQIESVLLTIAEAALSRPPLAR